MSPNKGGINQKGVQNPTACLSFFNSNQIIALEAVFGKGGAKALNQYKTLTFSFFMVQYCYHEKYFSYF